MRKSEGEKHGKTDAADEKIVKLEADLSEKLSVISNLNKEIKKLESELSEKEEVITKMETKRTEQKVPAQRGRGSLYGNRGSVHQAGKNRHAQMLESQVSTLKEKNNALNSRVALMEKDVTESKKKIRSLESDL